MTEAITQIHPYDVPEIIAVDIKAANKLYHQWVIDETTPSKTDAPGGS